MKADNDLEQRLRELPRHIRLTAGDEAAIACLAVPPRRLAIARRRSLLIPALAGLLVAVIAGNAVASYLAPRYAAALASAPAVGGLSGPMLRWAGLSAGSLTPLDDSVTANGHTVRLLAGRADELRTVLFLEVDGVPPGQDLCLPPECTDKASWEAGHPLAWTPLEVKVTDQFGHIYDQIGNESFKPLTGPAASVGARLTLQVRMLARGPESIRGDWTLHATLLLRPAPALALPVPMQFEGNTYRITSARADGLAVVHYTVTGPAVEEWARLASGPAANHQSPSGDPRESPMGKLAQRYFRLTVTGPDVIPALLHGYWFGAPHHGPMSGEVTFVAPQPGAYRIRFGVGPEATLMVPPTPNR